MAMVHKADVDAWFEKPVAVLGAGVSGKAVSELLGSLGGTSKVYDEQNSDFPRTFTTVEAKGHRLVVASPGFSDQHPWMKVARQAGCEVIGELDLACIFWKGRIIAVTGTNGKTTLVEFITHSLKYAGREAYSVGNIGHPFASLLLNTNSENGWAVVEVSSFQAELMRYFRADFVIWSNFSEDHLDRYASMEDYFAAKARLLTTSRPKTSLIGRDVEHYYRKFSAGLPSGNYVIHDSRVHIPEYSIFNLKPQRANYRLASALFRFLGYDPDMLLESVRTFKQGPHRLTPVAKVGGVEFWNDSKATNFSAAEAALKHFSEPVCWIGGGRTKGGDIEAFALRVCHRIKKAFLTGDTAQSLARIFDLLQVEYEIFDSLQQSVVEAYKQAHSGDVVLFSPGFASQKPFRNYSERGNCFEKVVFGLKADFQITN